MDIAREQRRLRAEDERRRVNEAQKVEAARAELESRRATIRTFLDIMRANGNPGATPLRKATFTKWRDRKVLVTMGQGWLIAWNSSYSDGIGSHTTELWVDPEGCFWGWSNDWRMERYADDSAFAGDIARSMTSAIPRLLNRLGIDWPEEGGTPPEGDAKSGR